jgi:hypothetical protein
VIVLGGAFAAIVAVDLLNPQYDPVVEPASRYVHGTAGWLIVVSLLAIGVTSMVLVSRLGRPHLAGRAARIGRWALATWAGGVLVAAVFPADPPGQWSHPSVSDTVHGLSAWVALTAFPIGAVALTRAIGWPVRLVVPAILSVAATVILVVFFVDVIGGPTLPTIFGLLERLTIAANVVWLSVATVTIHKG